MRKRISIVITCFNYEAYVEAAIRSALAQTYDATEIIVVDDGSVDRSLQIISTFSSLVRVVTQSNQGSISAYNKGYAESTGDIVVFLDADDLLEPDALEAVSQVWTEACVKVQYDLKIIDGFGQDLGRRFCYFPQGYSSSSVKDSFRRTATYRWPVTSGNAFSRTFLAQMFPLKIERGPDGHLNTIAPLYGDIVTVPRALGSYRLHGKNGWSSNGSDPALLPWRIQRRYNEFESMRRHAALRNYDLPNCNPLDFELPFINHRLIANRCELDYKGSKDEGRLRLVSAATSLLIQEPFPLGFRVSNLIWFLAVAVVPRWAVKMLLRLRFARGELRQATKRRLGIGATVQR